MYHNLFAHSPADRYFSYFWCLVIMNATSENILGQVSCVICVFTSLESIPVAGPQAWWIFKIKCCVFKQQQQKSEKETLLKFLELLCISECDLQHHLAFLFPLGLRLVWLMGIWNRPWRCMWQPNCIEASVKGFVTMNIRKCQNQELCTLSELSHSWSWCH